MDSEEGFVPFAVRFKEMAIREMDAEVVRLAMEVDEVFAARWRAGLLLCLAELARVGRGLPVSPEGQRTSLPIRQRMYRLPNSSFAHRILFVAEEDEDGRVIRILRIVHGSQKPLSQAETRRSYKATNGTGTP